MSDTPRFATLLVDRRRDGNTVSFTVTPDWLQGRTTFGGLIAALAVQAMRDVAGADAPMPPLRALQTGFVGPVGAGPMDVKVTLLRAGRNVRQVQAMVTQPAEDGGAPVAAMLLGTFGTGRASVLPPLAPVRPPAAREAAATPRAPWVNGASPAFTRQFDLRWADGALPWSGVPTQRTQIHLALLDDRGVDAELLTVLYADVPPSPVVGAYGQPTPLSSVTWALELRPLAAPPAPGALWRIDMEALAVGEGYVNQRAELWAPDGTLAALAYQVVAVYG